MHAAFSKSGTGVSTPKVSRLMSSRWKLQILGAVGRVGAAVGVAQALDPRIGVLNAGAGRRGDGEGHALRPVIGGEALESLGGLVERLVPSRCAPTRRVRPSGSRGARGASGGPRDRPAPARRAPCRRAPCRWGARGRARRRRGGRPPPRRCSRRRRCRARSSPESARCSSRPPSRPPVCVPPRLTRRPLVPRCHGRGSSEHGGPRAWWQ